MLELKKAAPEECGIPVEAVQEFEKQLEELQVRLHGYLLLSGKNVIGEKYTAPYGPETNHRMYSIAKSFTALAVGLLVKEGKVALDDKICDYFPEKLPQNGAHCWCKTHPWCAEMTIRDMLTMRTCYAFTTFKRYDSPDWTESFFRIEPDHVPGTVFAYDTSSAHVLAALVEKLTGMDMLDYMRQMALDKVGFSKGAYMMKDPVGVSQGGSGLMCTLRDLARVAYLCNHYGVLGGEELFSQEYMREATSNQVPTDLHPTLDEQQGYGYMFWMPRKEGFVMYGMGGQLAVCFPKLDFCLMTMADTIGSPAGLQMIYDCFYRTIYPHLVTGNMPPNNKNVMDADVQKLAADEKYVAQAAELQRSTQDAVYKFYENQLEWKWVQFNWHSGEIRFETPEGEFTLTFGSMDNWHKQLFPNTNYKCECAGVWKQGHFILHCFVTDEEQGHVSMDFAWKDERLTLRTNSTGEPFFKYFKGFGSAQKTS